MNFRTPIPALFPGASGRIVTALTAHHTAFGDAPLPLAELARDASVALTQLEATLFRLGLLGMLEHRARGDHVRPVRGHIAWKALDGLADLGGRVVEEVRARAAADLDPAPAHLTLSGPVADGSATHPADVLELIVVPPHAAPADWPERIDRMAARLSRALGNLVTVRITATPEEAGGPSLVITPSDGSPKSSRE
ncbi:hypothetical protein [Streptomyces albireticuli]|uniref:Uncharacterized protein n=1 Tax=Streptomyces albireticuli TaxID=1940 RepID=A0A2A2D6G1_9ACTN|nr:hypothetical protein [Streptomyces albireticuli]MCD9195162.1 hypothetical protein [Streptomyces albireticuli]PAU47027.1 hypothetical protein CK936_20685 [Streptomyces albireticuli]